MTLPEVLRLAREGLQCPNCELYSWEQKPGLPFSLTRCSRCHTLHYCSKECQEEHWVKVHKAQCSGLKPPSQPFFACSKELVGMIDYQHIDMDVHDPRWCSMCKEEDENKGVNMTDNPSYGCHVAFSMPDWEEGPMTIPWGSKDLNEDIRTRLPFDIYEMDDIQSGAEKILWLLQALLYKMKMTKYPLARAQDRQIVIDMRKVLQLARVKTWLVYMTVPKNSLKLEYEASMSVVRVLASANYEEAMASVRVKSNIEDKFGLWNSFKLLSELVLSYDVMAFELASLDKFQVEEFPKEYRSVVEEARATGILSLRDSIVSAFSRHLVKFDKVLELLCGGLDQKCNHCLKKINIQSVYSSVDDDKKLPSLPFVTIGLIRKYCCADLSCTKKVLADREKEFRILNSLTRAMRAKFVGNFCDFCFMVGKEAHRCSG